MKNSRSLLVYSSFAAIICLAIPLILSAQSSSFHHAPASAKQMKNPYSEQAGAIRAGRALFEQKCAACHGPSGSGTGNVPTLTEGPVKTATSGEVFWFITKGDINNGMPAWASLPESQRWQLVSFVKSLSSSAAAAPKTKSSSDPPASDASAVASKINARLPAAPFTDFRVESPGRTHKITVNDLPMPFATESAANGPTLVPRPSDAWPKALPDFKVNLFADGFREPRLIRTAPNGDLFLAETGAGQIRVFHGLTSDGKPQQTSVFATGLKRPYGIAFYPPGADPKYVYVGNTDAVARFPYHNGDLQASGAAQRVVDLPSGEGHWTRDIQFTPDGKKMFVAVGSASNVDDPDTTPEEKNRADILEFNPDGTGMSVYAYGIRNAGGGLLMDTKTGELWCSVNERDGLGDNLVPDYITHVEPGGFYGWPWWYMGGHQDPRHKGSRPELKEKVITPDVLLQAHHASLEMTSYDGRQFPAEYQGDIFAAQHGSWNRAVRTGYEVIRVPRHQTGHASGDYEDFLTGFVLPDGNVWGRPVGVAVASDGSLIVTDDGSNSIWRVSYAK